jgi:two-component system cell cycle sensor histidine kinase/response regulator CckA
MAVKKDRPASTGGVEPYSMLHHVPGAAAVLSFDGEVHAWNDEAAELLGWRAPLRAPRLGSPTSPWLQRLLERVRQSGRGSVIIGHRRGEHRIAIELRARFAQEGELLVLLRECTSQLRSRRARKEDERGLRQFLDQLPEPIVIEQQGIVAYANDAAVRLIGRSNADDLIGESIGRVLSDDVRDRIRRMIDGSGGEVPEPFETLIPREAGPPAIVQVSALPLFYRRRRAVHYLLRDVTEHRQTLAGLRATHERLRLITDVVRDHAILTVDHDQRVVSWNASAERLTGYGADDIIRSPFTQLYAGRRDELAALFDSAAMSGRCESEMAVRRQDGSLFPALVTISTLHDPVRDTLAYAVVLRDLSERQKAEESLRRSEEQLRHAQKMDAIGRLAAGIAHDFNNILTAIQGHAQFLLEDLPPVFASREDAVEIKRAADRATELTRQLLTFARRQPTQPVALDVNDTVIALEKMLRRLLPTDIRLDIVTQDVASVFVDPSQFEQVIVNLVVNARDAMLEGGTVTIRTSPFELDESYTARGINLLPGEYVLITVSDTGHGMSVEVQRHIFEPFFTTKTEGTGLGLPTVYGIVQQARGYVSVYSDEGVGTTFKIYLPVAKPTNRRAAATPAVSGEGVVLLVEDDAAVRALARRTLEQRGFHVIEAEDGEQALEFASTPAQHIDVVVTDLSMPKMRGDELAARIRVVQPKAGIVLMSGYTEAVVNPTHHHREHSSFLEKPFTPDSLTSAVRDAMPHMQKKS